jgi:D-alanyl-D-alanine carboxypeptidase/D-alanyl-D-alanine-endopeptidase (penicillin-binding protein 4)
MWPALVPAILLANPSSPVWVQRIESILKNPALRGASYGVVVADSSGKVLYAKDPDRRLLPASNQKLISCAFALHCFRPDFRPQTLLWKSGDTLTISSSGDPSMTVAKILAAREKLGGKVTLVRLHQTYRAGVHGTWENDDLPNRYAAPITAFTADRGSFEVRTQDGAFVPIPSELMLTSSTVPGEGAARARYDYWNDRVVAIGKPTGTKLVEAFALRNPDFSMARFFGLSVVSTTQVPTEPPTAVIEGDPMTKLVADCLQPSDNLYAENLLLMAAQTRTPLGSSPWTVASQEATKFLDPIIAKSGSVFSVRDGSGLSRQNAVTARGIVDLLAWSRTQPWSAVYEAGMARGGVGTLSGRLAGSSFRGKTGTLSGVVALSGFLKAKSGDDLIVSLIVNNSAETPKSIRGLVDEIVVSLEASYSR